MQASPRLLSPSQYNNTNSKFHHRSTPQVPRTSPSSAYSTTKKIILFEEIKIKLVVFTAQRLYLAPTFKDPLSACTITKKGGKNARFTFDRLLTLEMRSGRKSEWASIYLG
jgi:hypothetical protein